MRKIRNCSESRHESMAKKTEKPVKTVPYIPFKTFVNFIDGLKSTTVPTQIDSSLMSSMSGSMRSWLMTALRFLDLVDSNGVVQPKLHNLISAYKSEGWQDTLKDVISDAYVDVVGDVDLDSGTSAQLYEAFRKRGNVDGQLLEKAVRFYLAAVKEAGMTVSPHFATRPRRKKVVRRKKKASQKQGGKHSNEADDENEDEIDHDPATTARFEIPIPDKDSAIIVLPRDIEDQDWDMVKAMLDAYVKRLTS